VKARCRLYDRLAGTSGPTCPGAHSAQARLPSERRRESAECRGGVKSEVASARRDGPLGRETASVAQGTTSCLAGRADDDWCFETLEGLRPWTWTMPPSSRASSTPAASSSGSAHCEYFWPFRRQPHFRARPGPHPYKHGYAAGGSSPVWCAVGAGEVERAIGGDQGGSNPHACQLLVRGYGMKSYHLARSLHRRDAHRGHHRFTPDR
jgi:hypothetical protein